MSKENDLEPIENGQEPEEQTPSNGEEARFPTLAILTLIASFVVLCAILAPNFIRARAGGRITACKSNLKNIGTACEMYSTDYAGKYPARMELLLPNYLKTLPECPATGTMTYKMETGPNAAYNTASFEDYYFISCHGDNHSAIGLPPNYPQYDGIRGLIER